MNNETKLLHEISKKTKGYLAHKSFSVLMEMISFLLFIAFILLGLYLPDYLKLQLDVAEDETGFYILDPEEVAIWMVRLRFLLYTLSVFPLVSGVLVHLLRGKNKKLREVHAMANNTR